MVVFPYGSAVLSLLMTLTLSPISTLFVDMLLACLQKSEKDGHYYAIKEKPLLTEEMRGGPDYIVLKTFDKVDKLVEEFAGINRGMEKTGTFTMHRKKLFQLPFPRDNHRSGEEHKSTPVTGKKSSGSHHELVLGLPCRGQFEIHRSSKKLGGGGERNVVVSSHKTAKEPAAASSSVDVNATPVDEQIGV
ncbi:hypothetical protein Bca101_027359 [Brassica carinata]